VLFAGLRRPAHTGQAMVFRSHCPIFRCIDHGVSSHVSSIRPAGAGANGVGRLNGSHQLSFGMESPNALRWRFDRPQSAPSPRYSRENCSAVPAGIPMAAPLCVAGGTAIGAEVESISAKSARLNVPPSAKSLASWPRLAFPA
jgi:hypothetical protein